ncbi:MAG TPA: hypothetical protein VD966_09445 [Pyrinomonadaceae bacterium]|nr:hypothetical protein [Pyrinomonadaceae bacterium]
MLTRLILKPGQKGTKKLLARYGKRLICVRYRYDEQRRRRYTTVELIVEAVPWEPQAKEKPRQKTIPDDTLIDIQVHWGDLELSRRVKNAGGIWNRERRVWQIRYDLARKTGLLQFSDTKIKHLKVDTSL